MGDLINLRQARKASKRRQADTNAAANRAKFGQPKAVRIKQQAEAEHSARLIDGAKLERD